jgi:flavin-dependent dehydrogenase
MNWIRLMRDVPELASVDVCVIGGGPAGTAAAVAARRCGRSVILLERTAQLGGMATTGAVAIWMSVGTLTGFYKEICRELELSDFLGRDWNRIPMFVPLFNPFRLRHYLNGKLEEAGATVHFHMEFVAAINDGGTITHAVVMTREGLRAVRARQFIDCTGNASVAIAALHYRRRNRARVLRSTSPGGWWYCVLRTSL